MGSHGAAPSVLVAFEPDLVFEPSPTVRLRRQVVVNDAIVAAVTVWSLDTDDAAEAQQWWAWLSARPEQWSFWGRMLPLVGAAHLEGLVRSGAAADAAHECDELEAARLRAERDAELHEVIESFLVDRGGRLGVTLQRGDEVEPFWTIVFGEKWERERFRDWWRWQRHRFADFAAFLEERDALDLERLVLAEMLATEKTVKAAGLSAGGRRPLRFWRGEP